MYQGSYKEIIVGSISFFTVKHINLLVALLVSSSLVPPRQLMLNTHWKLRIAFVWFKTVSFDKSKWKITERDKGDNRISVQLIKVNI